jgi:hypothetical protein
MQKYVTDKLRNILHLSTLFLRCLFNDAVDISDPTALKFLSVKDELKEHRPK